jgi:hypothetical protein
MVGLETWVANNATHPDIKSILTACALERGQVSCRECAARYLAIIQEYATLQDKIGWENFMMGVISTKIIFIQELHHKLRRLHQLPDRWVTDLMTRLFQITHAQWIYQCFLVQDRTSDMLIYLHKTELLKGIANQLSLGAEN